MILRRLMTILFLTRIRLSSSRHVADYLRRKYDGPTLRTYRQLESSSKKLEKAQLDYDFLLYCKLNNIVPNFVKFKIYRRSLYNSEFYKDACLNLLDMEIAFKSKAYKRLESRVSSLSGSFYVNLHLLDRLYLKSLIRSNVKKYITDVKLVHERKLMKLGVRLPKFLSPKDVIFNYSDYCLSKREEFLLSLGVDFCLPNFRPSFPKFFLSFELLFNTIRHLPMHSNLELARQTIQSIAHKAFSKCKVSSWFPFFKREDFDILRKLSGRDDLVVCKPDKGRGVVLMNRGDYIDKMNLILADRSKFIEVGAPDFASIYKTEDKINRTLKKLKDDGVISDPTYQSLYSSGSSYGILYGLPKVHKDGIPLRPILAAYNLPSYPLAKFLVPILSSLTTNQYTLLNSSEFVPQVRQRNSSSFMVSFDVASLFTNVPLNETIELILSKLFCTDDALVEGLDKSSFRKLLELSVLDTNFIFNKKHFKQIDGMAMGSPLGPAFANIFMCHLEEQFLELCPNDFKPVFYKRYVDDTFVLFNHESHAELFLNFINNCHPNIQFSMDVENNNRLSFLDINIIRENNVFTTGIYRKGTFTGLGLNFFSHCSLDFKINSCKTLLHRAFSLCSSWPKFHEEISFLTNYFSKNCYPSHVFPKLVNKFLDNIFRPKQINYDVPKKLIYASLPYIGAHSSLVRKELSACLNKLYPYASFKFIFNNSLSIGSLFHFKDCLPELMRSNVIYHFNCPKCNFGTYVGCTHRMLKVRIDSHKGVSHRTGNPLSTKENSAIRSHCFKCKHKIKYEDFKILSQVPNKHALLFLESLFIQQLSPSLNNSTTSIPLKIA